MYLFNTPRNGGCCCRCCYCRRSFLYADRKGVILPTKSHPRKQNQLRKERQGDIYLQTFLRLCVNLLNKGMRGGNDSNLTAPRDIRKRNERRY